MLTITSTTEPICIPTDFKIEITGITDSQGVPQDLATAEFYFEFSVGGYGPYIVSNTQNSIVAAGKLYFIFQDYPFNTAGAMHYRQLTRCPDRNFPDGTQDIWTQGQTSILFR